MAVAASAIRQCGGYSISLHGGEYKSSLLGSSRHVIFDGDEVFARVRKWAALGVDGRKPALATVSLDCSHDGQVTAVVRQSSSSKGGSQSVRSPRFAGSDRGNATKHGELQSYTPITLQTIIIVRVQWVKNPNPKLLSMIASNLVILMLFLAPKSIKSPSVSLVVKLRQSKIPQSGA